MRLFKLLAKNNQVDNNTHTFLVEANSQGDAEARISNLQEDWKVIKNVEIPIYDILFNVFEVETCNL